MILDHSLAVLHCYCYGNSIFATFAIFAIRALQCLTMFCKSCFASFANTNFNTAFARFAGFCNYKFQGFAIHSFTRIRKKIFSFASFAKFSNLLITSLPAPGTQLREGTRRAP